MRILIIQETDWIHRGPHNQHHLFERLSLDPRNEITVLDYDMDQREAASRFLVPRFETRDVHRVMKDSQIRIVRSPRFKHRLLSRPSALFFDAFTLLGLIKKHRPHAIVNYAMSNGFLGLLYAKLFGIRFIFHYIDNLHELVPHPVFTIIARYITRIALRNADRVLIHNQVHRDFLKREGVPDDRIEILRTGITPSDWNPDPRVVAGIENRLGIQASDFVIFFMGFLYDFAGLQEIIDRYNDDVKAGRISLKFIILGDGGIYEQLKQHVKALGADWVLMIGRVPYFDVPAYLALADLGLLPFKLNKITKECAPIKIYEHMALKKPTLAVKLPGIYSDIGEGNGVIFMKDQQALIEEIGHLAGQKSMLEKIGMQGYEFVQQNLIWKTIVAKLARVLRGNL
ncbi:MAG: glycosyltransferase family 4 protein [Candidatus Lokiarchaeota archaeon]|nr:glycosyltransferase family 4 protein [Candidatus Lokiarchaeota archaeon]